MRRIASLDLLRGIAAFSVAIPHYLLFSDTFAQTSEIVSILAVEVFFTLSGFVLAPQILYCMHSRRLANLWTFLVRRWMRTIPPFLVALVVIAVLSGNLFSADFVRYAFYVQNLFAQHNNVDFFSVAWSLSIEEWFYVTFPALLFVLYGLCGSRTSRFEILAPIGFIAVVTIARTVFGDDAHWGSEVRRVVVFRIDSIAYGFLLHVLMGSSASGREGFTGVRSVLLSGMALAAAAAAGFATAAAIASSSSRIAEVLFPFVAAALGMSAICFFYGLGPLFERHKPLAAFGDFVGKISYSVYLFHIILVPIVFPRVQSQPMVLQVGIFVGLLVVFCAVFYQYFERPILSARPRYKTPPQAREEARIGEAAVPLT